ncbi:hypothetical protein WK09_32915 [Burkholderia ubonensis]|uniref:MBG domain-containing protein n=1 Tax=Burkholderia ubonensis TaxID=101571 RepID=UPI000758A167|nr:MBG domain-containing protein [Burkholderia ubonensis]KVR00722.1 hypothetical protein WK09_32915 [Burkholderia ubonensis]
MNQIYRVIWSRVRGGWVVVAEQVVACGKQGGQRLARLPRTIRHPALRADPAVCGLAAVWPIRTLIPILSWGLLLAALTVTAQAQVAPNALPTGGTVSAGSATISQAGSHMQINQGSQNAALNWNTFNIGRDASVTFNQPSAQSVALNRVASADPSQIYGALNANGKLILINPNGVVFGQGAQINAAGLIATTKALSDADFMQGNYRFAGGGTGVVQNHGTVVAAPDGSVLLMADKVINTGSIRVRGGTVGLLSGSDLQASPDWQSVAMTHGAAAQPTDVVVDNSGRIDVSGAQGGRITLNGGDSGIAQSSGQMVATGDQGQGGQIRALGYNVGLLSGSQTDASGLLGGGTVLVGGNWQGSGAERHAANTYMDPDAVIRANALHRGDGGQVVLWSDNYTNFQGTIQARGGAAGGNGGQVETSSHGVLTAAPRYDVLDVTAPAGRAGSWLLDPSDVTIASAGSGTLSGGLYNPTGASGTIANTTINAALNAGTNVTISTAAGTGGGGNLIQNVDAPIAKTAGDDANLKLIANLTIGLNGGISSSAGKLNVSLDASGGTGIPNSGAIVVRSDISTNGGDLSFLSGTSVTGTNGATNLRTAGGKVDFRGDVLIANTSGVNIDTATGSAGGAGGGVTFAGKVDSGDAYAYRAETVSWDTAAARAQGTTSGGAAVGDSYLATPLSAFQNLLAGNAAGFAPAWLGGTTGGLNGTNWYWGFGPKKGLEFNTTRTGVNPVPGVYSNWKSGEPNNVAAQEYNLQFTGRQGQWNDLPLSSSDAQGYVVETNLAASPLTINAGGANVVFNGPVGSLKPLASLTVTGPTAINGGQVTTEQGQTYNSPVTIGNVASTLLESTLSTLQLDSAITYSGTTGSVLTARANKDVEVNAPIRATGTGALTVNVSADTTGTVNGGVTHTGIGAIRQNAAMQSNGGDISLSASSGITGTGAALSTGSGAGNITVTNSTSGNIVLSNGSTLNAGTGNITVTNAPTTGGGTIALQDLTGGAVTVANQATDLAAGTNAVTLNGPVSATGAVSVTATTGDVQVNQNITSTAQSNPAAVVVAAGTSKNAADASGGNVKFTNSKIGVASTSRGIVYTGSLAGTTGVGATDAGYPGAGRYRYNVGYNDTSRLSSNTGTYVQYREQPALTMTLSPGKVYDAVALNGTDWANYTVTGWQNGDTGSLNALSGNLSLNGSTSTVAKNVGNYTAALGTLADTLGYRLTMAPSTYAITPAPLTITGTPVTKNYGTNDPALAYTATGLVGGETAAVALSGNLGRNSGEAVGSYNETQGSLVANNGNYTLTFVPSTLTVNRNSARTVNVVADAKSKIFGSDDPTLTYQVSGSSPFVNTTVQSYDASGTLQNVAINDSQATALTGNLGRQSGETVGSYGITRGSLSSANYLINFTPDNLAITPAALSVNANAQTKDYGQDDPDLNYTLGANTTRSQVNSYDANGNRSLVSVSGGGTPQFSGHLGRMPGENVGQYQIVQGSLTAPNYTISYTPADLTIRRASAPGSILNVVADSKTKVYGQADPALTYQLTNLVNRRVQSYDATGSLVGTTIADTVSNAVTGSLARGSGENVGTYAINQGTLSAKNYQIDYTPANFAITPAPLTITGTPVTKNYGTNDPALAYTATGLVGGETAAVALSGNLGRNSGEAVGSYNETQGSLVANNGNYTLAFVPSTLTINKNSGGTVNIVANVNGKTYGSDDPILTYMVSGGPSGDTTVRSYNANGTLEPVTISGSQAAALTGNLGRQSGETAGNYAITQGSLSSTNYSINFTSNNFAISPAAVRVSADGKTKVYGQLDPALTYRVTNPSALVNRSVQSYDSTGKLIGTTIADNVFNVFTGNAARVSGEDVGTYAINRGTLSAKNYQIDYTPANFGISPAPIVISGLQAQTKVYDTTTLAQLIGGTLTGVTPGDVGNVNLGSLTGNFSDKNVGTNKTVLVSNGSLTGSRASNYYIDYAASGTIGTITPAPLRISDVRPQDRVYDGTNNATFTGTPTLSGVYASDVGQVSVPIQNVTGRFSDKNVGTNKTVTADLSAPILSGPEAGNYQVTRVDSLTNSATITPALLQISATSATKFFDGTVDSDVPPQAAGLMPGDALILRQKYDNALPGPKNSRRLSVSGYELSDGNGGNNYVVAVAKDPASGTIKAFPNPNGMGGSRDWLLESENLNLLPPAIAGEDILQRADQGSYFEKANQAIKATRTSPASSSEL